VFLSVLTIAISLLIPSFNYSRAPGIQDITGGAKLIFGRPDDPEVRQHGSASRAASQAKDAVEDALALANSARNANPPRYHDAQVAYRLAAKLNPKDPRPSMGLGNIWYDQKQFAAAAKMYREALSMMTTMPSGGGTLRGQLASAEQRHFSAELRGSFGLTLLQIFNWAKAQEEFERALRSEPTNARWHALRGYSLFKQGNKPEAVKAFQEAVRLDPGNSEYEQLLQAAQQ
jgi:Flp pilus assembly protein TadD